jgi:predicted RNA-binding Zn ribbon-like protein
VPADAPLDRRVVVETAMAMVDVIRADELSRMSVCADERCGGLVLDLSRNRSRRFCSTTCANRNAVAAYRARGRTKADA